MSPPLPSSTPPGTGAQAAPSPTTLRVLVSGKVQGVWFRESTREQAERLGVRGWVRNLPDGRVEGLFTGPGPAVEDLVDWCRRGPPAARVESVVATPATADEPAGEGTFRVLR